MAKHTKEANCLCIDDWINCTNKLTLKSQYCNNNNSYHVKLSHLKEIVADPERQIRVVLYPGCDHSSAVPVPRHHKRVINGDPKLHIIPESLEAEISVVPEDAHQLRVTPAA